MNIVFSQLKEKILCTFLILSSFLLVLEANAVYQKRDLASDVQKRSLHKTTDLDLINTFSSLLNDATMRPDNVFWIWAKAEKEENTNIAYVPGFHKCVVSNPYGTAYVYHIRFDATGYDSENPRFAAVKYRWYSYEDSYERLKNELVFGDDGDGKVFGWQIGEKGEARKAAIILLTNSLFHEVSRLMQERTELSMMHAKLLLKNVLPKICDQDQLQLEFIENERLKLAEAFIKALFPALAKEIYSTED